MQCDFFVTRLDALLTGDLDDATRTQLQTHAAQCERCGTLLGAMQAGAATTPPSMPAAADTEAFVARLLQRTSGSACARAQMELPDWVDGGLAADETDLVALHLQHCGGCAALATVLGALRQELPALAHAEPGPAFTAAVVAATRTLRPRRAVRWFELWQQLVGRPRLALELPTAACFVLMLLCALPFSPFRPLPQQALAVIRVDAVTVLQSAATQVGPVLQSNAARVWAASGGRLESAVAARRRTYAREHVETVAAWSALRADMAEAGAGIRSLNVARLSHALLAMGADLRRLFGADAASPPATPQPEGGSP